MEPVPLQHTSSITREVVTISDLPSIRTQIPLTPWETIQLDVTLHSLPSRLPSSHLNDPFMNLRSLKTLTGHFP